MRARKSSVALVAAATVVVAGALVQGATLNWDADGVLPVNGGSGVWDTTSARWEDGAGNYVAWTSGTPDNAVFGPNPGTLTLGENITVGTMTFNTGSDGYTIDLNGFGLTQTGSTTFFAPAPPAEDPPAVVPTSITITNTSATTSTYTVTAPSNAGPTLAGNMNVTLTGTSTAWTPQAAHSFTGVLTLQGTGTVTPIQNSSFGSAAGQVVVSGGRNVALSANGVTETYTRDIQMATTGGLGVSGARWIVVSGAISGGAWKTFNTQGALVLTGDNTFDGKVTVASAGNAIVLASTNALGVANADSAQNVVDLSSNNTTIGFYGGVDVAGTRSITGSGTFRPDGAGNYHNFGGDNSFAGNITLGNQQAIMVEEGSQLTLKGVLGGARTLTKRGEGTLVLANTMTYGISSSDFRRMTRVIDGTIRFDFSQPASPLVDIINNVARSSSDNVISLAGGTLEFVGKGNVDNSQYFGNTMRVDLGASSMRIVNAINNRVNVRISGTTITRVVGGTVDFGLAAGDQVVNVNGYTTGKVNTNGIIGGYATANQSAWASTGPAGTNVVNAYVHSAAESEAGAFDVATHNVDVTAANSAPAPDRTVNSIRIAVPGTLTLSGTNVVTSGGILVTPGVGAANAIIAGGTLKGADTADLIVHQFNADAPLTILSDIADNNGATALTKVGPGMLVLAGNNTYSGTTYVHDGVLKLSSPVALPAASSLALRGGVVGLTADMTDRALGTGAGSVQWLGDGGFAAYGAGQTRVVSIGGGANLQWNSTGSSAWENGGTSGTIAVQGMYKAGQFVGTGYKLIFGATDADGTVEFQNNVNLFGGANIYLPRTVEVVDGPAAVEARMSGVLSGSLGSLIKAGGGTLELSGINTYGGSTEVNGGRLLVTGSLGSGSIVTVNAGGTLGGTGTVGGPVTVKSGGTVAPGASVGTLTLGSLTIDAGGSALFEIEGAASSDKLVVNGAAKYGGTLKLAFAADYGAGTWDLVDSGSSAGNFGAIVDTTGRYYSGQLSFDAATGVLKALWAGDADADGGIDGDDYALLDRGAAMGLTGWGNGDFNGDGVIDAGDYMVIDTTLGRQGGMLSPGLLAQREAQFGAGYVAALTAAVPEPAGLGLVAAAAAVGATRRRRNRA